jgi:hypothetical protein
MITTKSFTFNAELPDIDWVIRLFEKAIRQEEYNKISRCVFCKDARRYSLSIGSCSKCVLFTNDSRCTDIYRKLAKRRLCEAPIRSIRYWLRKALKELKELKGNSESEEV